jgi:L-alanine-DL-glutamate epimerase-like enolase superfamily enzyme
VAAGAFPRIGSAMEPHRPFVFDDPVPFENLDAMQRVAESINIPIATGERLYPMFAFADLLQ